MTVELAAARQRVDDERSHARDPALPTDAPATDRLTALRAEIEKLCAQKPGRGRSGRPLGTRTFRQASRVAADRAYGFSVFRRSAPGLARAVWPWLWPVQMMGAGRQGSGIITSGERPSR